MPVKDGLGYVIPWLNKGELGFTSRIRLLTVLLIVPTTVGDPGDAPSGVARSSQIEQSSIGPNHAESVIWVFAKPKKRPTIVVGTIKENRQQFFTHAAEMLLVCITLINIIPVSICYECF
ncbi:hypothetical protein HYU11_04240 [Candidatus Woesearchaeota archaeon]|nr:hypothetical protein [Candidatus Woesearchaeota archaeon]